MSDQPAAKEVNGYRQVDVIAEFGNSRNQSFIWPLTKEIYRGRWLRSNLNPDEHTETIAMLPDMIPGMRVRIDGANREITIYDPLATDEYKDMWRDTAALIERIFKSKPGAVKTQKRTNQTDDNLKTALYQLYRMFEVPFQSYGTELNRKVGGPQAILLKPAKFLTLEQIEALPGSARTEFYNQGRNATRKRDTVMVADDEG